MDVLMESFGHIVAYEQRGLNLMAWEVPSKSVMFFKTLYGLGLTYLQVLIPICS